MALRTLVSRAWIINPELPGASYIYEPSFSKLSRVALKAYARKAFNDIRVSTSDQAILAGTGIPSDRAGQPDAHSYSPLTTQIDAKNYLQSIVFVPPHEGITPYLFEPIDPTVGNSGVRINTPAGIKECYCITIPLGLPDVKSEIHKSIVITTGLVAASSRVDRDQRPVNPGDNVEIFLVEESFLRSLQTTRSDLTAAQVATLPVFEYQPVGKNYFWVFSNNYIIDDKDSSDVLSPTIVNIERALKPKAASGTTFPINVTIKNPAGIAFAPGLQVAVNNRTKNGHRTVADMSTILPSPWIEVTPVSPATSFVGDDKGGATLTITAPTGIPGGHDPINHAVTEGDELEFFLRVLGDPTNVRSFTITAPLGQIYDIGSTKPDGTVVSGPRTADNTGSAWVGAWDIVDNNSMAVTLQLFNTTSTGPESPYGLRINIIDVLGSLHQHTDESMPIPDGARYAAVQILSTGATASATHTEDIPSATFSPGEFSTTFTSSDPFIGTNGVLWSPDLKVNIKIRQIKSRQSGGLPVQQFYPRIDFNIAPHHGETLDADHNQENIPVIRIHLSSLAGQVKAHIDLRTSFGPTGATSPQDLVSYPNGFSVVPDDVQPPHRTCGILQFIGNVINGPWQVAGNHGIGLDLPNNRFLVKVIKRGTPDQFAQTGTLVRTTSHDLPYSLNTGMVPSGWTEDFCDTDTANIRVIDTQNSNAIYKIDPSIATTGVVVNLDGTVDLTLNAAMFIAGTAQLDLVLTPTVPVISEVRKFSFKGKVFIPNTNTPILYGARMLIHNVTRELIMVRPLSADGSYDLDFDSEIFNGNCPADWPVNRSVAGIGDQIRYMLFDDFAPFLPAVQCPAQLQYPSTNTSSDRTLSGDSPDNFGMKLPPLILGGPPRPNQVATRLLESAGTPTVGKLTSVVEVTLTADEIRFAPDESPARGQKTADFEANYTSPVPGTVQITSTPIQVGKHTPIRALPFIDIVFPKNVTGQSPFEFEMLICRNANDPVASQHFEPILSFPEPLPQDGRFESQKSTLPLRLHIFDRTKTKETDQYAISLRVRMKKNGASGRFTLNSWGVRWWNAD